MYSSLTLDSIKSRRAAAAHQFSSTNWNWRSVLLYLLLLPPVHVSVSVWLWVWETHLGHCQQGKQKMGNEITLQCWFAWFPASFRQAASAAPPNLRCQKSTPQVGGSLHCKIMWLLQFWYKPSSASAFGGVPYVRRGKLQRGTKHHRYLFIYTKTF